MTDSAAIFRPSFRALERALLRRAAARIEPVLWFEIAALAALASAFLFWQAHMRMASLAHDLGAAAALRWLGIVLALLAAAGGVQVGARHFVRLRAPGAAPPWLSLPIPVAALARHLGAVSRVQGAWLAAPAAGFLVAALGIVPWGWLALLALAFIAALDAAGRLACTLALRLASAGPTRRDIAPLTRVLAREERRVAERVGGRAHWGGARGWAALWWNDVRLTRRVPTARRRAGVATLAIALSCLAWRLPIEPRGFQFVAFAFALFAAATVAEWLIALIGSDPADTLRTLPIGLGSAWGTRALWALMAVTLLVAGHAFAARGLAPGPLRFFLICVALAALAITTLGVNYGISLYPRVEQAQRVFALSLGISMAASLMIPLMGWIVLLTAVLHSSRRVARWSRAEER